MERMQIGGRHVNGFGLRDSFSDKFKEEEDKATAYIDSLKALPGPITAGLIAVGAALGGAIVYAIMENNKFEKTTYHYIRPGR